VQLPRILGLSCATIAASQTESVQCARRDRRSGRSVKHLHLCPLPRSEPLPPVNCSTASANHQCCRPSPGGRSCRDRARMQHRGEQRVAWPLVAFWPSLEVDQTARKGRSETQWGIGAWRTSDWLDRPARNTRWSSARSTRYSCCQEYQIIPCKDYKVLSLLGVPATPPDRSTRCLTDRNIILTPGTNDRYPGAARTPAHNFAGRCPLPNYKPLNKATRWVSSRKWEMVRAVSGMTCSAITEPEKSLDT
jgi:hypothetical protein